MVETTRISLKSGYKGPKEEKTHGRTTLCNLRETEVFRSDDEGIDREVLVLRSKRVSKSVFY